MFDKLYERIDFKQYVFKMYHNEQEEKLIHNYEIVTGLRFLVKWVYIFKGESWFMVNWNLLHE